MKQFFWGFLLFCVWAVLAAYYYNCEIKKQCNEGIVLQKSVNQGYVPKEIKKPSPLFRTLRYTGGGLFPDNTEYNKRILDSLVRFIEDSGIRMFTIIGVQSDSGNLTTYTEGFLENVALERASALRKLLREERQVSKKIYLDFYETSLGGNNDELIVFDFDTVAMDTFSYEFTNMTFSEASFSVGPTGFIAGKKFRAYADSVRSYLAARPERSLRVIGYNNVESDEVVDEDAALKLAKMAAIFFIEVNQIGNEVQIQAGEKTENGNVPALPLKNRGANRVQILIE